MLTSVSLGKSCVPEFMAGTVLGRETICVTTPPQRPAHEGAARSSLSTPFLTKFPSLAGGQITQSSNDLKGHGVPCDWAGVPRQAQGCQSSRAWHSSARRGTDLNSIEHLQRQTCPYDIFFALTLGIDVISPSQLRLWEASGLQAHSSWLPS